MIHWHEKAGARIGLRLAGLALLASAWADGSLLHGLVQHETGQAASAVEFLLAALLFVSASGGAMLTFVGAALWKPVRISARWAESAPGPQM